jgi:hypothetical protein
MLTGNPARCGAYSGSQSDSIGCGMKPENARERLHKIHQIRGRSGPQPLMAGVDFPVVSAHWTSYAMALERSLFRLLPRSCRLDVRRRCRQGNCKCRSVRVGAF